MSDQITAYTGNEPYIFISYAHKDTEAVLPLIRSLQQRGFRVWYDGGIVLGNDFIRVITKYLGNCHCTITFLSPNYDASDYCTRELAFAVNRRKQILPVYLTTYDPCDEILFMAGSGHALFLDKFAHNDAFLDALDATPVLQPCRQDQAEPKWGDPAEKLESFAQKGDAKAMLFLGKYHLSGEFDAPKDPAMAASWLRAAYEAGDAEAKALLDALSQQLFCEAETALYSASGDPELAAANLRLAAGLENAAAQKRLGECCLNGWGMEADREEAILWLEKAAASGDESAKMLLSSILQPPPEVPLWGQSTDKLRSFALQGNATAMLYLGKYYASGEFDAPRDPVTAAIWLKSALDAGEEEATPLYGELLGMLNPASAPVEPPSKSPEELFRDAERLFFGIGGEKNEAEAFSLYQQAAEADYAPAQNRMGECRLNGWGTDPDRNAAKTWFLKAIQNGSTAAKCGLGLLYIAQNDYAGRGNALRQFTEGAVAKDPRALCLLGICYEEGIGATRNMERATEYYMRSAELGYAEAQWRLANIYQADRRLIGSKAHMAPKLFQLSADQGHARAQNKLGEQISGQDPYQAAIWFKKAAGQGLPEAIRSLSICYRYGNGVPENPIYADELLAKSQRSDNAFREWIALDRPHID